MFNELIVLITEHDKEYNESGFEVNSSVERYECYASIKSTTYKEYYEASRVDEQVTDIFVLDERDYNNAVIINADGRKIRPNLIEYDGMQYRIVRRYRRANNATYTIELTCKEVE